MNEKSKRMETSFLKGTCKHKTLPSALSNASLINAVIAVGKCYSNFNSNITYCGVFSVSFHLISEHLLNFFLARSLANDYVSQREAN